MIDVVAFDGDDTLWHSEHLFADAHERFAALLAPHVDRAVLGARLRDVERANLALYGYGVKGFALSLVETAIELTDGDISGRELSTVLDMAKAMLSHPVELLDGAREAVEALSASHRLVLVTKGDLLHQESKVARSGLAERFERVEIVVDKDHRTYRRIVTAAGTEPSRFLMVGNSLRSEVLPVLAVGGHAAHVPYEHVSHHEHVDDLGDAAGRYHELASLHDLPALVRSLG